MQFLQNAAAPCALFTLGVTVAAAAMQRIPWDVPFTILAKLIIHPAIVLLLLTALDPSIRPGSIGVLMAALPPALNVFIMARQYDTWWRRPPARCCSARRVGGHADQRDVAGENRNAPTTLLCDIPQRLSGIASSTYVSVRTQFASTAGSPLSVESGLAFGRWPAPWRAWRGL